MKLTKEHIGQKFKVQAWDQDEFFLLLGITSRGTLVGEYEDGGTATRCDEDDWLPYDPQPKQEVLMSPALVWSANRGTWILEGLQSDKPLRVGLKNCKSVTNYSEGRLVDRADIEADLWIKLDGEQS